ncbi:type IV secretion system protein [Alcaligenaceae bacterium]|nr:type IV secretion system protein [Alcaligenaceae bacterium]
MAGIFETMSGKILDTTEGWADIPAEIISWVMPMILAGLTISIMWHGYKIVRGAGGQDHLLDVFFNSTRTFLVVVLCLTGGMYSTTVIGLLQELRNELTSLFSDGTTNSYATLDVAASQVIGAFKRILEWGSDHTSLGITSTDLSGLIAILGGGVMTLSVILYCITAAVNFLMIDVSLLVLFAIGPLFVACLAFQSTSSYFNTWFAAVLKYVMTAAVIAAVVGMGTSLVSGFAEAVSTLNPESTDYVTMTFSSLAGGIILIVLTSKAASIGAEMAGGAALQILSLAQAARWAANPAGAALSVAGKAGGAAGKLAGAAAGHVTGRAAGAVARTGVGQAMGSSRAMQYAMSGVNAMSQMGGGARTAMSHRSAASAARAGFQSGSSLSRGQSNVTK